MNAEEAIKLCRFAKAACPQQAIDEHTPEAWFLLLGDLRFVDAKDGLVKVTRTQPFVSPAEIRAEVKRIRAKRLTEYGPLPDPPADLDDRDFPAWLREIRRRIADGEPVTRPALPAPDVDHAARREEILGGAFRTPEDDDDA